MKHKTEPAGIPCDSAVKGNAVKGEKRSHMTHAAVTVSDARLDKQSPGAAAVICFVGYTPMENRNGLIVYADGSADRNAAPDRIPNHTPAWTQQFTLAAEKGAAGKEDNGADLATDFWQACVAPHVAQKVPFGHQGPNHSTPRL